MGKRQFTTLDGLRGVAALLVVGLHGKAFFAPIEFASAYLAVDLFFALSGFVLEHAYAERFRAGLTGPKFLGSRIARLYPLYLVGALIGTASGLIAWRLGAGLLDGAGVVIAATSALLMLPSFTFNQVSLLYVYNVPAWSLFLEFVVNAVYGLIWPGLTTRRLVAIVSIAAGPLIWCVAQAGNLDLGSTWPTLPAGLARVAFSFFLGVLMRRHLPAARGAWWMSWAALAAVVLLLLFEPGASLRPIYDLALAMVVLPTLIGVAATVEPGPRSARVMAFLGAISFPIYAVHYPSVELARRALRMKGIEPAATAPWSGLALVAALIGLAWALARIDVHARRTLVRASVPTYRTAERRGR